MKENFGRKVKEKQLSPVKKFLGLCSGERCGRIEEERTLAGLKQMALYGNMFFVSLLVLIAGGLL